MRRPDSPHVSIDAAPQRSSELMVVMVFMDAMVMVKVAWCSSQTQCVLRVLIERWPSEACMKSDTEIERDVREELEWHPDLDATDVAVSVKSGVVTLAGFVKSYSEKYQAEAAAKRVSGVAGVANDLEVRIPSVDERSDPEIARDAVSAIKSQLPFSWDRVKVLVKNGWVTLEGIVAWQYQKTAAENAVRGIKGVRGISNLIALRPTTQASEIKTKILEAFRRNAEVDAKRIQVEANGSEVVLKGTVRSWIERAEAERIAWSAPGVTKVEDRIVVARLRWSFGGLRPADQLCNTKSDRFNQPSRRSQASREGSA